MDDTCIHCSNVGNLKRTSSLLKFHLLHNIVMALALIVTSSTFATDADIKGQLARVAGQRVLFGHQSVGANILDGVRRLADSEEVQISIIQVKQASELRKNGFAHLYVAENGNASKKIASFEAALSDEKSSPDIALVKLCYVDFSDKTNVQILFEEYQSSISKLQRLHPRTTFVHITTPITTVQGGIKGAIKRLIGRAPYGAIENQRRNQYNELVRHAYLGREPVFDLAALESIGEDGKARTDSWNGVSFPVMVPEYTTDGGHLNETGQLKAAKGLIKVLSEIAAANSNGELTIR